MAGWNIPIFNRKYIDSIRVHFRASYVRWFRSVKPTTSSEAFGPPWFLLNFCMFVLSVFACFFFLRGGGGGNLSKMSILHSGYINIANEISPFSTRNASSKGPFSIAAVDGRNPAPVKVGSLPHYLHTYFYASQVVIAGFLNHQLYVTGWWFQIFFIFTPKIGEDSQFDEHVFHRGWFNHQWFFRGNVWGISTILLTQSEAKRSLAWHGTGGHRVKFDQVVFCFNPQINGCFRFR